MPNIAVQTIRGFPFSKAPWFTKKNIEDTLDYKPLDGDIIITSYPKTGTTWMQYIVLQIVTKGEVYPPFDDILTKSVPFMEMTGVEAIEKLTPPRLYKHHYPYDMVKKNRNAKFVYTYRNPVDAFVSFFHFLNGMADDTSEFDQFFENFLTGDIAYGNMFRHVRSYWEHRDDDNLLLVSYEKLIEDRRREILRVAKFLGEEHYRNLINDGGLLDGIVEKTGFDYMKKNLKLTHPILLCAETTTKTVELPPEIPVTVNFFRKGTTGEGKKALSEDQLKRLRQVGEEIMKGTGLMEEWFKE